MKDFIMSFPVWFWMIIISAIILPLSYRLFRKGIRVKVETKLGSAEIDAEDEPEPEAVQNDKQD